ncbi:MAG: FAD-dependent oxidoreductase [Pseudomonadota bacterium]
MKIAIVGSGISGLGAAYALKDTADVTVFEQAPRLGGHAHTVDVTFGAVTLAVDVGFIVLNERNYPNLLGLFEALGVPTKPSDMSFGLSMDGGALEYAVDNYDQIFAQRKNLLNLSMIRGLRDILRFNREAGALLDSGALDGMTLRQFIERYNYSDWYRDCFATPFGGAIWSTPVGKILDFPARNFVAFFRNHDLMQGMDAMQKWRTVDGGSRQYVQRIAKALGPRARVGVGVTTLSRASGRPVLGLSDGTEAQFDQVILACHGPQARALIQDLDREERTLLSAFKTLPNTAYLHSDPALMPKRRKVWSSWNFLAPKPGSDDHRPAPVTYWMQRLQGLPREHDLFVSLNPDQAPRADLTHGQFAFDHPYYDEATFAAQAGMDAIQGRGGVWYAGAWLGYGFHEDGLRAGLRVATSLGASPAWARDLPPAIAPRLAAAAE